MGTPQLLLRMQVLTKVIKYGTTALQLRATDVMLSAIQHDPAPLRAFMRSQKDNELFHLLVRSGCTRRKLLHATLVCEPYQVVSRLLPLAMLCHTWISIAKSVSACVSQVTV